MYKAYIKLVTEKRTSPRHMTDKDEATIAAFDRSGTLRDTTLITLMLHTGLRSMEVCDLKRTVISIGKRSGELIVQTYLPTTRFTAYYSPTLLIPIFVPCEYKF